MARSMAAARAFARKGAGLVVADLAREAGDHLAREIGQAGGNALFIP